MGCTYLIQSLQKGKAVLNTGMVRIWVIHKILTELWPFFDLNLAELWFLINSFEEIKQFHSNFTEE